MRGLEQIGQWIEVFTMIVQYQSKKAQGWRQSHYKLARL